MQATLAQLLRQNMPESQVAVLYFFWQSPLAMPYYSLMWKAAIPCVASLTEIAFRQSWRALQMEVVQLRRVTLQQMQALQFSKIRIPLKRTWLAGQAAVWDCCLQCKEIIQDSPWALWKRRQEACSLERYYFLKIFLNCQHLQEAMEHAWKLESCD